MKRAFYISIAVNILLVILVVVIGMKTGYCYRLLGINNEVREKQIHWKAVEYEKGWTNCLVSLCDTVDVAFYGNSITHGGNFHNYFPDKKICNLGYPSDDLRGMKSRVGQLAAVHPQKVFVMGGFNGLSSQSIEEFKNQYKELIDTIRYSLPETEIYLQSILPVNVEMAKLNISKSKIVEANSCIEAFAKQYGFEYVDLYSVYAVDDVLDSTYTKDGVHLKREAYKLWVDRIRPNINQ